MCFNESHINICNFFQLLLYSLGAVLDSQKNWREDTEVPWIICLNTWRVSPSFIIPHLVTIDQPMLAHHNHPKSNLAIVHSMILNKCHNNIYSSHGIIQSIFTALKFLSVSTIYHSPSTPPLLETTALLFDCLYSFAFYGMSYCWSHTACNLSN